jgi:hypothetical protein
MATTTLADLTMDAGRPWAGDTAWDMPLAFIDLGRGPVDESNIVLPPCPAIGLGDRAHPLAAHLDAVIESPVSADAVIARVLARPKAAAVIVQLSSTDALSAESMAYAVLQGSAEHSDWLVHRPVAAVVEPGRVGVVRDGDRLTITLDRPEAGNAIDRVMRDQLCEALSLAALDREIAVVSLRANGRTFSLGADLGEFGTTTDPATAHAIRQVTLPARWALRCADRLDAHVQGGCVGAGLELAACAARLTASPDAWFQLPELAMGILPGAGGCVSLTRRIGRQRTALLILSGKRLSARQALDWGLVDAIVDDPA